MILRIFQDTDDLFRLPRKTLYMPLFAATASLALLLLAA